MSSITWKQAESRKKHKMKALLRGNEKTAAQKRREKGKTALYRHYNAEGKLLYVGISLNHLARLTQHRSSAHWYEDIVQVTIEWFATRDEAENAEQMAIIGENPLHNEKRPDADKNAHFIQRLKQEDLLKDLPANPQVLNAMWNMAERVVEMQKAMEKQEEEFERVKDLWNDIVRNVDRSNDYQSWVIQAADAEELKERTKEISDLQSRLTHIENHLVRSPKDQKESAWYFKREIERNRDEHEAA